ncbi:MULTISPECIES: glycosyltransferase family 1 protein [unclassified Microbacterium]|uniref:rhamnosyltransferase WsaF family glycosyltransferase n=1 Tax=unclassified Microbacterium TaxID=2609290 RepID=UPI00214B5DA9|nr:MULTISPECIES: glycosyltransferase family 1 protein [unclassified Microbacterium]MCR2784996.1 glycosyltransferase family 1 protein [Microbacterium sp. zg.B96]WIM16535.1 glycosyltransferase family 1 protein [Microbacterium sp. zg-B96]
MVDLHIRAGKAARVLRTGGAHALIQRAARAAYRHVGAAHLDEDLLPGDIADSLDLSLAVPTVRPRRGEPLTIGWVTAPPAAGSGGHTTLLRMVEAVEQAGHRCVLFVYDRYGGDLAAHERVLREWWPNVKASVRDGAAEITGVDAAVASSWDTAHVLARRGGAPMRRLYFVQDFEPYFYGRGSWYSLAEDTYRFGFRTIALGHMVATALREEIGIDPDVTEFGCDTSVYRPLPDMRRTGVVLYARPDVARRGFWLARLALEEFHRTHPDVEIHLYGSEAKGLSFPATQHGKLSPVALNELYNRCVAGLAMSFTNISLVAEEMLAAGTIPVVNDSRNSRADLPNDQVAWAAPTPLAIARALGDAVSRADRDARAAAAAASVRRFGWTKAQTDVARIIEDEVYGPLGETS